MQRFGAEEFQILNKVEGLKDASEEAYKERELEKEKGWQCKFYAVRNGGL